MDIIINYNNTHYYIHIIVKEELYWSRFYINYTSYGSFIIINNSTAGLTSLWHNRNSILYIFSVAVSTCAIAIINLQ